MAQAARSLIWLALLAASLKHAHTVDYCDTKICPTHKPNIGCKNNRELSPDCPAGSKKVEVTDELKKLILDTHNKYRSTVATGGVPWLPKASGMPTLTWDDDLQDTAQMNANQCVKAHDPCHNTDVYLNSGQNINKVSTTEEINVKEWIPKLISSFWDERHDVNANMVNTMYDPGKSVMVFHFAVLASDKVNKVGCGLSMWPNGGDWKTMYIVCNYSFNDFIGIPIYNSGEPCSACKKGCNPKYPGLCNEDEPVPQLIPYPA